MPERATWRPTPPWNDLVSTHRSEPVAVQLSRVDICAFATIIARPGKELALAQRLRERFGCDLPKPGRASFGRTGDLIWSSPAQWLAFAETDQGLAELPALLADCAVVTDQSDSRALLRISGPRSYEALAKSVAIDLHPTVFPTGSAAVTKVAHMSVQIWRIDDGPTFMIAAPRSFSGSFWSWADAASASVT